MANNLYLLGKALNAAGHNVIFIRERDIAYALSQPVWEDCELTLSYDELPQTADYSPEQWTAIEKKLGWLAPKWLWDPLGKSVDGGEHQQLTALKLGFSPTDAAIMRKMRECDILITSGAKGSIIALQSGIPYVIQPHGGDLMIAARLLRMIAPKNINERLFGNTWEQNVRTAFNRAVAIATHSKYLNQSKPLSSQLIPDRWRLARATFGELATYTPTQPPLTHAERGQLLENLAETLGFEFPTGRYVVFVPSRVDFFWKGQDRLMQSLQTHRIRDKFHFIFAGWGENYAELRASCQESGSSASFLGHVFSKPLLYELMAASDLVVDNFVSGHYGTTGVEAMGRGTPLLTWCEPKQYRGSTSLPPVLQAKTPDDIERMLLRCADGRIDLQAAGRDAYRWAIDHHSESSVASQVMKLFKLPHDR